MLRRHALFDQAATIIVAMSDSDHPGFHRLRVEPSADIDALAADLLDAAIEVHRYLGPGFLEAIYEEALSAELTLRGMPFVRQASVQVQYKRTLVGDARIDLLVGERLIVELKAVDNVAPIHIAQAMSYRKATKLHLALLSISMHPCSCVESAASFFPPFASSPWRPAVLAAEFSSLVLSRRRVFGPALTSQVSHCSNAVIRLIVRNQL